MSAATVAEAQEAMAVNEAREANGRMRVAKRLGEPRGNPGDEAGFPWGNPGKSEENLGEIVEKDGKPWRNPGKVGKCMDMFTILMEFLIELGRFSWELHGKMDGNDWNF